MRILKRDTFTARTIFPLRKSEFRLSRSVEEMTTLADRAVGDCNRPKTIPPTAITSPPTSIVRTSICAGRRSSAKSFTVLAARSPTPKRSRPGTRTPNSRRSAKHRAKDLEIARKKVKTNEGAKKPSRKSTVASQDPLLAFRDEFPILAKTNYLVSNSLGPMPRTVPEKLAEYARDWGELGVKAWNRGWWEYPVEVGNEIAPLINAGAGEIVMMPNVTIAQTAVLSSMDFSKGRDTVVMTDLDFPSVRYAFAEMAQRLGARVVSVRSDDGIGIDLERLLAAIDERTCLVAVSHVLFRS